MADLAGCSVRTATRDAFCSCWTGLWFRFRSFIVTYTSDGQVSPTTVLLTLQDKDCKIIQNIGLFICTQTISSIYFYSSVRSSSPSRLPFSACSGCCKGFTLLIFPKQTWWCPKVATRGAEHEHSRPRGPAVEVITFPAPQEVIHPGL